LRELCHVGATAMVCKSSHDFKNISPKSYCPGAVPDFHDIDEVIEIT
jgi:hypothetical protein